MSGVSRVTLGIGVAAVIVLGVAMAYYHLARPGADLPLQLPEGRRADKGARHHPELWLFGSRAAHERLVHRRRRTSKRSPRWPGCPRPARRFATARRSRTGARASRTRRTLRRPRTRRRRLFSPPRSERPACRICHRLRDDGAIAHADRDKAIADRPRGDQESLRARRVGIRARSGRALLPRGQDAK